VNCGSVFGRKLEQNPQPAGLTEEKVNDLISASLARNNESLASARTDDQKN